MFFSREQPKVDNRIDSRQVTYSRQNDGNDTAYMQWLDLDRDGSAEVKLTINCSAIRGISQVALNEYNDSGDELRQYVIYYAADSHAYYRHNLYNEYDTAGRLARERKDYGADGNVDVTYGTDYDSAGRETGSFAAHGFAAPLITRFTKTYRGDSVAQLVVESFNDNINDNWVRVRTVETYDTAGNRICRTTDCYDGAGRRTHHYGPQ